MREVPHVALEVRSINYSLTNKDGDYLHMLDTKRCTVCWGIVAVEEINGSGGVMITCVGDGYGTGSCRGKWWVDDATLE